MMKKRMLTVMFTYFMDITDMQVQESITPALVYTTNAGEAHAIGFELDMFFNAGNGFSMNAGFGYNDIEFEEFSDASGDYKGNRPPFMPEYTFNLGAQYRHATGIYAGADVVGVGKMYFDKANEFSRDPYALVNAKMGYEMGSFDVYLCAKNLFDENYDSEGYQSGFYTFYGDPREIGLQLTYRF
jgi:iron complex outermembrane receptor protein